MKKGYLSQYFDGFAIKRLSKVEVDVMRSNQHEFNGVKQLKNILGYPSEKITYQAKFIYMSDDDTRTIADEGFLTWYESRKEPRSECRLYFPKNLALDNATDGDLLLIAKRPDNSLFALIAKQDTTIEQQILWLFGVDELDGQRFVGRENLETEHDRLDFTSRFILEEIGIEVEEEEGKKYLDIMLQKFNGQFPSTHDFSKFARHTLSDLSSHDNPDQVLLAWMEREENLFKAFERHLLDAKLKQGFGNDVVDGFLTLSLSVQNRRKSRAGSAFENHLEQVFIDHTIHHSRGKRTENKHKPDFVFPSIEQYRQDDFPAHKLTMLAAKTTCKDRWRQILNEAARIQQKHLFTLEPSISKNQTDEMKEEQVQLVLPSGVHKTYAETQQTWLFSLSDFIRLVKERQV